MWQGLDYTVQLDYKTRQVRESLEHLGGLRDFELRPIAGMADPWRYRNRADFSIGRTSRTAGRGLQAARPLGHGLPICECQLLDPGIEPARGLVEAWLREEGLPAGTPGAAKGSPGTCWSARRRRAPSCW